MIVRNGHHQPEQGEYILEVVEMETKRFVMEYLEKYTHLNGRNPGGRTQEVIFAETLKQARQEAKRRADIKGIDEYYVYKA